MMGKELVQFDVENKIRRSRVAPSPHEHRIRDGVKGGIDFHHVEMLRIPTKAIRRAHLFWIPKLDKTGIGPTGGADEDLCSHESILIEAVRLLNLAAEGDVFDCALNDDRT